MANIFTGTNQTTVVRATIWDPREGYRYVDRQQGSPTAMEAAFSAAQAAGYRCRIDRDHAGGYATLEIEVGRDPAGSTAELSNEWYLLGNDLEKSLFEHPKIQAFFTNAATPQQRATYRSDVEAVVKGTKTFAEVAEYLTEPDKDVTADLVDELSRGSETYVVSQFVLRNTVVLAENYAGTVNIANVNEVYPNWSALASAELTLSLPLIPAIASLAGEWLKKTPTFEPQGKDKWRVERE